MSEGNWAASTIYCAWSPAADWNMVEFHLLSVNGRPKWKRIWLHDTDEQGMPLTVDARLSAAQPVLVYPSLDSLLVGAVCTATFMPSSVAGISESVTLVDVPQAECTAGRIKDGSIGPGDYTCAATASNLYLRGRAIRLLTRGTAAEPELFPVIQGNVPKPCYIEK
jgi:hypothetical protein